MERKSDRRILRWFVNFKLCQHVPKYMGRCRSSRSRLQTALAIRKRGWLNLQPRGWLKNIIDCNIHIKRFSTMKHVTYPCASAAFDDSMRTVMRTTQFLMQQLAFCTCFSTRDACVTSSTGVFLGPDSAAQAL